MQPRTNTYQKPKKKLSKVATTIVVVIIAALLLTMIGFVFSTKNIFSCAVMGRLQMNSKRPDIQDKFNSINFVPGQESTIVEAQVEGRDCVDDAPRITINKKITLSTSAGSAYESISKALITHGYKADEDDFTRTHSPCSSSGVRYFSNHGQQVEVSISCADQSQEKDDSWKEIPATQADIKYRLNWYSS